MNREIKFRAWNGKKMIDLHAVTPFALSAGMDIDGLFIPFKDDYKLMQYTGLKDSKGVEIYEGDLLKHKFYQKPVVVSFDTKNACFIAEDVSLINTLEVIGNIYENPNLLNP